jgi:hypothetical protein
VTKLPVSVLSWSRTAWRNIESVRDHLMHGLGTNEPWIMEQGEVAPHWRKPLRLDEINQMAQTPEVKARPGRP